MREATIIEHTLCGGGLALVRDHYLPSARLQDLWSTYCIDVGNNAYVTDTRCRRRARRVVQAGPQADPDIEPGQSCTAPSHCTDFNGRWRVNSKFSR